MSIRYSKEQLMRANEKLIKRNRTYKEALEFYADERNYVLWNSMATSKTEMERDRGHRARGALEEN